MFYNLLNGQEEQTGNNNSLHCYRSDTFIFFCDGRGQHSIMIRDNEMESFCQFLESALVSENYVELKMESFLLAFEKIDEGSRNLCMVDSRLYMIYNLDMHNLVNLPSYLRKETERQTKERNWVIP